MFKELIVRILHTKNLQSLERLVSAFCPKSYNLPPFNSKMNKLIFLPLLLVFLFPPFLGLFMHPYDIFSLLGAENFEYLKATEPDSLLQDFFQ